MIVDIVTQLYITIKFYNKTNSRAKTMNFMESYVIKTEFQTLRLLKVAILPTDHCKLLFIWQKLVLKSQQASRSPLIEVFQKSFKLDCSAALDRIREGRPITIKDDKGNTSKCIADIVSLFITVMDKLRLGIDANDELQPDLRDLQENMNRLAIIPQDFEGRTKVQEWIGTFEGMTADETLSETQVRQMIFDLESAYNAFNRLLQHT
ncbi:unnamed protein product, partial [Meganyctiphanes norvegica]